MELSIRSGLVTEHDLVPAGPVDTRNEEVPNAEEGEGLQEQGEESADEHDPIVEFAPEPDAETEPRASQDVQPLAELSHATTSRLPSSLFGGGKSFLTMHWLLYQDSTLAVSVSQQGGEELR